MKKLIKSIKAKYYERCMKHCQNQVRKSDHVPTIVYWLDLYWDYSLKLRTL